MVLFAKGFLLNIECKETVFAAIFGAALN